MMLTFTVPGLPIAQGSKKHVGNGIMVESARNLKPWRDSVIWAAREALAYSQLAHAFDGPVEVTLWFGFPRPKSHYRTGQFAHLLRDGAPQFKTSAPDLDKLVRACLDSLTIARVFRDDAQVAVLRAAKEYDDDPGLTVTVIEARP
jgi:crossover junction endodeoxyribonuclease RusA